MNVRFMLPFLLILTACSNCSPAQERPIDYRDTPVVKDSDSCGTAQKHLNDLCNADPSKNSYCCAVVEDTKKGKNFETFCHETQDNGIFIDPTCLSSIVDCSQIDMCTGTKPKDGGLE